jgi:hypothetical protein
MASLLLFSFSFFLFWGLKPLFLLMESGVSQTNRGTEQTNRGTKQTNRGRFADKSRVGLPALIHNENSEAA